MNDQIQIETQPFNGVDAIIDRMEKFPHEFFETGEHRSRWAFIFKDYFKDTMNESEKGRIFEAMKKVRKMEFEAMILKELFKEEKKEEQAALQQAKMAQNRYKA